MRREVSAVEAAHVHKVTTKTIERWRKDGSIEARKDGRRWLYVVDTEPDMSPMSVMSPTEPSTTLPAPLNATEITALLSDIATKGDMSEMSDRMSSIESTMKDRLDVLDEVGRSVADSVQTMLSLVRESTETVARLERELAEARKPWYRKIFGR